MNKLFKSYTFWIFIIAFSASIYIGQKVKPVWYITKVILDVKKNEDGRYFYKFKDKLTEINPINIENSKLNPSIFNSDLYEPKEGDQQEEFVIDGSTFYQFELKKHYKYYSLLPILIAVLLCWLSKEPVTSLLAGVLCGAVLLGRFDITEDVLLNTFMSKSAAGVLILYLWLLGGLLGIWSRTGATLAFTEFMTKNFVKGPRSAKLVAWFLGVIFFQGGTVSTLLVGTSVKPLTDKWKISHEELSYIVDSTAAPIACLIALNAWPGYIQSFLFVSGVPWLATEADRLSFFFRSVPFSFYAIFAVIGTFLLSIDKAPFLGKKMKAAILRARITGKLDADDAEPLSAKEINLTNVPKGYQSNIADFLVPLFLLIITAVATFIIYGSPNVRWAFGVAVLSAFVMALLKGMKLKEIIEGISSGCKGVVFGTIILMLAITIGQLSKDIGGAYYLVQLLGDSLPYWSLPIILQLLTMIISFSTGTSWGTFAVTYPLSMPLSLAVAQSSALSHPIIYMMICFATVLNGSVYGDQCSPISDTTVVTAMTTGSDLMDHVKTQIPQASIAAFLAAICWTLSTIILA